MTQTRSFHKLFAGQDTREERDKRKAICKERDLQNRMNNLKSKVQSLQEWKTEAPILRAAEIAALEWGCGWPPDLLAFWPYVFALGANALLYLYAAENIHQSRVVYVGVTSHGATLTWLYAARKAYHTSQRGLVALSKLPPKERAEHSTIESFFRTVSDRAERAENVNLQTAMNLPTFFHLDPGKPVGATQLGIDFFALQTLDKPLTVMERIKSFAVANKEFSWLQEPVADYSPPANLAEDLPVTNMRVLYESHVPLAFRFWSDPDPANYPPPDKRRALYGSDVPQLTSKIAQWHCVSCHAQTVVGNHIKEIALSSRYGMYTEEELPVRGAAISCQRGIE
jgi:hypothetical protein